MSTLLGIILSAAALWPLLWLVSTGQFRQLWPCLAAKTALFLLLYGLVIATVVLWAPGLLPVFAVAGVMVIAAERWYARTDYGRSRGMPPGSLAIAPLRVCQDDRFLMKQAEKNGPVFKLRFFEPTVCVVGNRAAIELFREHESVLKPTRIGWFNRLIPRGFLRYIEGDDHKRYRKILRDAISPEVIDRHRPRIAESVGAALRLMATRSEAAPGGIAPKPFIDDLVFVIFAQIFFGIAPGSEDFARLRTYYDDLDIRDFRCGSSAWREPAHHGLVAFLHDRIDDLLALPEAEQNAPNSFLAALAWSDRTMARDPTVIGNLIYIFETARWDLAGLLFWLIKKLSDHPDWTGRLRRAPDNGRTDSVHDLADRIVKETLRLEQSELLNRSIDEEIRVGEYRVPKGWLLRVCVREGHRDPRVFPDPDRFDPDRFRGRSYQREEYAPFGLDRHRCIGVHLTETVARAWIVEAARGYDIAILRDGRRGFQFHWEPSPDLRLIFTPAQAAAPS